MQRFYRYVIILALVCVILIPLIYLSLNNKQEEYPNPMDLSAEEVVINHFKYKNEKKLNLLKTTVVDKYKRTDWELNTLDYVEILSINEVVEDIIPSDYHAEGAYDFKLFEIEYEINFKKETTQTSGVYVWAYHVIKETEDSPWLITDWGPYGLW